MKGGEEKMRNILFDASYSFDTAAALAFLLKEAQVGKEVQLQGLTALYGKQHSADDSLARFKETLTLHGSKAHAAPGASEPLFTDYKWENFPESAPAQPARRAWDVFYSTALRLEGDVEIFAAGPLTNLAIFIKKY